MNGLSFNVEPGALTQIVERVVAEVLAKLEPSRAQMGDRLAFSEEEAARMLGLEWRQLRDERLRGRIKASQIVGRRIRYQRSDLTAYLAGRPFVPS